MGALWNPLIRNQLKGEITDIALQGEKEGAVSKGIDFLLFTALCWVIK